MSTLDMSNQPISELARSLMGEEAPSAAPAMLDNHKHTCEGYGLWTLFFWWVVIALIAYFTLFALKPDFVLEKDDYDEVTGEIDQGRLLGSAIVISLIIVFALWLLAWGFGYKY